MPTVFRPVVLVCLLAVGAVAPAQAARINILEGTILWFAPGADGGAVNTQGTVVSGAFDCAAGSFDATIEGEEADGYVGPWTEDVHIEFADGRVTALALDFSIDAELTAGTTVTGHVVMAGPWDAGEYPIDVLCEDGPEPTFGLGALAAPVWLRYVADIVSAEGTIHDTGQLQLSISASEVDGQLSDPAFKLTFNRYQPPTPSLYANNDEGTTSGSFSCGDEPELNMDVAGIAIGPYPGTFTGSVHVVGQGGRATMFDFPFQLTSGDTVITGEAHGTWGSAWADCWVSDEGGGLIYSFEADLGTQYTATLVAPGRTEELSGLAGASVNLVCVGSPTFTENCQVASVLLQWYEPEPPPEPPAAPVMTVSNSMGSSIGSFEGTTSGAFACGTTSVLDMDVAGNAYGPYPGTFTEDVHVVLQGALVQAFDVNFVITAGDISVDGEAHFLGGTADGSCSSYVDEDSGPVYQFSAGSGGGGHSALLVRYTAIVDDGESSHVEQGWATAGVNLHCFGFSSFASNCDVATSIFRWLVPDFVGDDGHASTGSVDEDNPSALSVDNPAGGQVQITQVGGVGAPSTYVALGQSYLIDATDSDAENPIQLTFVLAPGLLYDYETDPPTAIDPAMITVLRNGVPAANCADIEPEISPDPCVSSRAVDDLEGNLHLVVLTSRASTWTLVHVLPDLATPRAAKQAALAELEAMSVSGSAAKTLARAIGALRASLDDRLWLDDQSLDRKKGGDVFDLEKTAVGELIKKELALYPEIHDVVVALVGADHALAQVAIDWAQEMGAKAKDLEAARTKLAEGDAQAEAGQPTKAIDSYKSAWQKAVGSVK